MEESDEIKVPPIMEDQKQTTEIKDKTDTEELEKIKFPKPPRKRKPQSFMCEECGKIFNRADLLRNHKRVHSGDKPFTCEVCGDKFRELGHLRRHMTRHTGKKPYQCYICGKELNSSLAKHLRRHLNDRQFSCVLCAKKFVSGFELKQHILTHKKGTFQENSNRGTPSLDKREPKLYKPCDVPSLQGASSMPFPPVQMETNKSVVGPFLNSAQETALPFYGRLAAAEGSPPLENQFKDQSDPAMFMNWDNLSYVAGMMLTPPAPSQPQFKGKSSGRKRLSDLSWDIAQCIQKQQQEQLMKQQEQAMHQLNTQEETGASGVGGNDDTNRMIGPVIGPAIQGEQSREEGHLNQRDPNLKDHLQEKSKLEEESGHQIPPLTDQEETRNDPPVVSPYASPCGQKLDPSPPRFIGKDLININPESFTQVKHLTVSVKEEPLDVEEDCGVPTEDTAHRKGMSDLDTSSYREDFDYSTDEYEAEAYFQKLDDSTVERKDQDLDWTPESSSPKKTLKIKIKMPKQGNKRKSSKTSEGEVPKKKRRKKKKKEVEEDEEEEEEEEEEMQASVCTDSNTLFVISPEENGTPESKKKRSAKKDTVFVCDECGKVFFRNDLLRNHMRVHTGDKPFTCEVCGESFRESGHLRRHMTRHTGKKPYKCELCGKELNSSLAKHMRRHMNDRQFPCTVCDKKFVSGFELKHHMIIHNTSDHIPCHICGRKFSHTNILQRHMLTHSDNRPFPCPDCDKSYKCKQDLDRHRSIHKEVLTATCHICGKQFCQDRYLYRHLKRHEQLKEEGVDELERSTKIKPFSCEVCHQRFTTAPNLKQHMHLHFSTEKFACYLCSKMFTQKRYLQRHIRRHKQNRIKGSFINLEETERLMAQMVATFNEQNSQANQLAGSSVYQEPTTSNSENQEPESGSSENQEPDSPNSLEEGEVLHSSNQDQDLKIQIPDDQRSTSDEENPPKPDIPTADIGFIQKPVIPTTDLGFTRCANKGEDPGATEEEGCIPPNYLPAHITTTPHSVVLAQNQN